MNKIVKRAAALALSGLMVAGCFAGCSSAGNGSDETKGTDAKSGANAKYTIGICQLVQHDALDAATKGFRKAVEDKLGAENVTFDEQNAAGDSATCATIVNQFVSSNVDLIMANATPALQAATSATTTIPIVATSITDYATALDQKEWTGKTGINVTGTADLAPLEDQAKMIKELCPQAKTVGIIYCSAEANSKYQATQIAGYLKDMGIDSKEYTAADSNDIAAVTKSAADNSDVIYIPTDNTMASNTEIVNNVCEPAKIPVIAGEEGICKGCGIATLSIDYYDIGYTAGEMAADILQNGTDPAAMEIKYSTDLTKENIAERCTALGITVPSDYTAISTEK